MQIKRYKIGLVLSGGGVRGFAHLGVAKALYEKGMKPDIISGVSAGAIVGAFLAAGFEPQEAYDVLRDQNIMKISKISLPKDGLLKLEGLKKHIVNHIPYKRIEDLPIPLVIAVCNLNTARMEYFRKGPLSDIVLASSSIPVLFSPVRIKGTVYVDGGVLDNLPVKPVRKQCEKIIAVNINPVNETDRLGSLLQIAVRTFHVSFDTGSQWWGKKADLLIEPPGVDKYDILRSKHTDELYDFAYHYTKDLIL
jgi:NTE family protein